MDETLLCSMEITGEAPEEDDDDSSAMAPAAVLAERLATVAQGGGEKYVKLLRSRGKMLPRERIQAIIDPGSKFMELSALASWDKDDGKNYSAAIVTGVGLVHGRECMFIAN